MMTTLDQTTHTVTAGTSGRITGWLVRATGNIPATTAAAARTAKVVVSIGGANTVPVFADSAGNWRIG